MHQPEPSLLLPRLLCDLCQRSVLTDEAMPITMEVLKRMPYVSAVCKESLRLYPPASVLVREVAEDLTVTTSTGRDLALEKVRGVELRGSYDDDDLKEIVDCTSPRELLLVKRVEGSGSGNRIVFGDPE